MAISSVMQWPADAKESMLHEAFSFLGMYQEMGTTTLAQLRRALTRRSHYQLFCPELFAGVEAWNMFLKFRVVAVSYCGGFLNLLLI
mmetsp:Transcript_28314/g.55525  ORF Transcript_28314/g.55525 Transcript_28314/m.55525 type:complete len:87 (-) Transcript_28314:34-294(-)